MPITVGKISQSTGRRRQIHVDTSPLVTYVNLGGMTLAAPFAKGGFVAHTGNACRRPIRTPIYQDAHEVEWIDPGGPV